MIIERVRLQPAGAGRTLVSWTTSNPTWPAWVLVDGVFQYGPIQYDATTSERSITLRWPPAETHAVEIQEAPDLAMPIIGREPAAGNDPDISWNASDSAEKYRLYHRQANEQTDSMFFEGFVPPDEQGICHLNCPITLDGRGGKYHLFRVEAVDRYVHESTRASWIYWAAQPDDTPELTITSGTSAGLYDITLTE